MTSERGYRVRVAMPRPDPIVYTQRQWDNARSEGFEAGIILGALIMGLIMLALAFFTLPH